MKKTIEAPTDSNETPYAYAYARANQWGDGAELHLMLRRICSAGYMRNMDIEAAAYVSRDFSGVYGVRLVSDDHGRRELAEMQLMTKTMERIEKKLEAFNNELGYCKGDDAYPEFCRRVCVAAGITHVFIEYGFNTYLKARHGDYNVSSVFELRCIDPKKDGAMFLAVMQQLTDDTLKQKGKPAESAAA